MNLIYSNNSHCHLLQVYEHKNHKFRIFIDHSNGSFGPTLSIMANDGTWQQIETASSINVEWENLYFLNEKFTDKCKNRNLPVIEAFKKYIELVY